MAQKEYQTRYGWVGKVIHWELCMKLKFDLTNKWYIPNTTSFLENDTHKLLWDFDIQTDHLTEARRPDLIIINKKKKRTCKIVDFAVPVDHRIELKENEKKDRYIEHTRELKKTVEHESDNYTSCNRYFCYSHQKIIKGTRGLGNNRTNVDHPNYYIIENSQNTEKSPGDLRRVNVTRTPAKCHQLTLM